MSLDRKILDKIEKDAIRIIPRWVFSLRNIFSWLQAGAVLAAGSFAFAVAVFVAYAARTSFDIALSYVWLAIFIGFFIWGYRKLAHIGFDYVYKLKYAVFASVVFVANIALGFVFYGSGQVKKVEMKLEQIPAYRNSLSFEKSIIEDGNRIFKKEKSEPADNDNKQSDPVQEDQENDGETHKLKKDTEGVVLKNTLDNKSADVVPVVENNANAALKVRSDSISDKSKNEDKMKEEDVSGIKEKDMDSRKVEEDVDGGQINGDRTIEDKVQESDDDFSDSD